MAGATAKFAWRGIWANSIPMTKSGARKRAKVAGQILKEQAGPRALRQKHAVWESSTDVGIRHECTLVAADRGGPVQTSGKSP